MQDACDRKTYEHLLRTRDVQPSTQRVEVLYQLGLAGHLGAEELHELLNREYSRVSRATVYNTLRLLVREGLIGMLAVEPGKCIFDANPQEHYHFYDPAAHALTDIPAAHLQVIYQPPGQEPRPLRGVDVVIRQAGTP